MQAQADPRRASRDAFERLCLGYEYPVYAYVRRSGHAPAIAQDIARSFLTHLLHAFRSEAQPVPCAHFRSFLLDRLNAFLVGDWRDMGEYPLAEFPQPVSDVEARYRRDCLQTASPEQAFQRSFALEILTRASQRLSGEARQTGHLDMYETLAPFLVRDPGPAQYDDIAQCLHSRALAIVIALKRLRQRFRELVGEELAETVTSADELANEQHALHAVLRQQR
jgi:RNA polymerase sigma-70 factor (ECF subfamily)